VNRWIGVLALLMVGCFVVRFVQLNNLQIRLAPSLKASADEPFTSADPWSEPRGEIVSADSAPSLP
jgi:hypothetical protein